MLLRALKQQRCAGEKFPNDKQQKDNIRALKEGWNNMLQLKLMLR
jgi:hypothetical protein